MEFLRSVHVYQRVKWHITNSNKKEQNKIGEREKEREIEREREIAYEPSDSHHQLSDGRVSVISYFLDQDDVVAGSDLRQKVLLDIV